MTALVIKAARGYTQWGPYAANRFVQRNNLDPRLVRLARQLQAVQHVV